VYSQFAAPTAAAAYFVAFRFVQAASELSQAPFYSKLPRLARLYAEGSEATLIALAARGMRLAYGTFVLAVVALGMLAPAFLKLVGSTVPFVTPTLWLAMAFAFFVERFGGMHMQLFSITNRVVWHIANGVTGVLLIAFTAALLPFTGVFAFPFGMLLGYLSFYSWWSALLVFRAFSIRPLAFEIRTAGLPILVLAVYAGAVGVRSLLGR
jgi:hypothetical protein